MLCILNNQTDPYLNLATEEYLLHNFSENIFMLWQNKPSIIIGKHQNTLAEINYRYVRDHGINVVRRLSGGGTVYHDSGNINFTFIQNGKAGNLINFQKFTNPILEVLISLGINATLANKSDLMIENKKISGNAEHIYKNRVLHHGTLLFSSSLSELKDAIKVTKDKYEDKAVKSRRSEVTNISDHLEKPLSISEFIKSITDHILKTFTESKTYSFNEQDLKSIRNLVKKKYDTWEWNYGYSPRYIVNNSSGGITAQLIVEKGIITDAAISDNEIVEKALIGLPHKEEQIREALTLLKIEPTLKEILIYLIF